MIMKEIFKLDDSRMTGDPLSFETKVRDENCQDIDKISMDDQNKDSDNKDKKPVSPEHGNSVTVEELTLINENECRDSISEHDGGSDFFETVTNVFTDKNVLECDLHELEVTKDICVDDGTAENDRDLAQRTEDDKSASLVNQCEMKEDIGGESVGQEIVKASSVSSSENDNAAKNYSEEYGTRSVVETFIDSLNGDDGNKLTQPSNQIPIDKAVSEGPAASSSEDFGGPEESGKSIITFNFTDALKMQSTNSSVTSLDEQSLVVKGKDPDHSDILCANRNSSDSCHVRSPSDRSQCSTNDDAPSVEPNDSKWQTDNGEMSFSAVTYSGPIAFSGSLSHRSDASTTSARSFAFPVLQSEWNSSPVRMAKADRRHFRKQKGWRSGLLCCRF